MGQRFILEKKYVRIDSQIWSLTLLSNLPKLARPYPDFAYSLENLFLKVNMVYNVLRDSYET